MYTHRLPIHSIKMRDFVASIYIGCIIINKTAIMAQNQPPYYLSPVTIIMTHKNEIVKEVVKTRQDSGDSTVNVAS